MSQLARAHPEDDRYQSLDGQRELLAELDDYEGPRRAHQDREERRYGLEGPDTDERINRGDRDR